MVFCLYSVSYLHSTCIKTAPKGKCDYTKCYLYKKKKEKHASIKPGMRPSSCLWILFSQSQALGAPEEGWLFIWLISPRRRGSKNCHVIYGMTSKFKKQSTFQLIIVFMCPASETLCTQADMTLPILRLSKTTQYSRLHCFLPPH